MRHADCTQRNMISRGGYTLVEVLVYIALFSAISVAVIDISVSMIRVAASAAVNHTLEEGGYSAMETMVRTIRSADAIDMTASVFDNNDGELTLIFYGTGGSVTTKKLYVSNFYYLNYWVSPHIDIRAVQMDQNGALLSPVTGRNVQIDSLVFRRIDTPHSQAVRIEMTMSARNSRTPRTERFYDTVVLRGSY